ncbi:MAG: hypothetical protein IJZ74_07570 [Clostridia bacterium]|nr:hypothetical protein [Clostridia bacterium]
MHLNRTYILMGLKVALGAALAILLANLLKLQYSATAGIITVLSIMGTKRETLRIAGARMMALASALAIAAVCYGLLGFTLGAFTVYLFVFAVVCYACGWTYAIAMISVLITHFMSAGEMTWTMIGNEVLLFVIGTGCGILVNLHLRADEKRMRAHLAEVDSLMKEALHALSRREDAAAALKALQTELTAAEKVAVTNADNQLGDVPLYPIRYVQMRANQRKILTQIASAMGRIDALTPQHDEVCALIARVADEYHMENDVAALLTALDGVLNSMRAQALPVARGEFESRAVLYYVLLRLQDFLLLKRQFYEENAASMPRSQSRRL